MVTWTISPWQGSRAWLHLTSTKSNGSEMGFHLNTNKCELSSNPNSFIIDPVLRSFTAVDVADATLPGAPLFKGRALDSAWADRCTDLNRAVERLSLLGAQDALLLLRISFSAPRVQHLLRCSPSVDNAELSTFDNTLKSALCQITNNNLSDTQWLQASLSIKQGGFRDPAGAFAGTSRLFGFGCEHL